MKNAKVMELIAKGNTVWGFAESLSGKTFTQSELTDLAGHELVDSIAHAEDIYYTIHLINGRRRTVKVEEEAVKVVCPMVMKYAPKKYWDAIEHIGKDIDGWWVHLNAGYISTTTETETIHEFTVADMKKEFKTIVKGEMRK